MNIKEASERVLKRLENMTDEELLQALEEVEDNSLEYAFDCMKYEKFVQAVQEIGKKYGIE